VIAAVNGLAFGGGCEITEAVHLGHRQRAREVRQARNQSGHAANLRRNAAAAAARGRKRALELLLTGDPFTPQRAWRSDWSTRSVPHDEIMLPAARELAARIIRHSPLAVGSDHHGRHPRI
jgi:enoyl-CoA hydratase/carnithine racemase